MRSGKIYDSIIIVIVRNPCVIRRSALEMISYQSRMIAYDLDSISISRRANRSIERESIFQSPVSDFR